MERQREEKRRKRRGSRANTGHAVLISMSIPPKMKMRNGLTDQWTDRLTYRGAYQHLTSHPEAGHGCCGSCCVGSAAAPEGTGGDEVLENTRGICTSVHPSIHPSAHHPPPRPLKGLGQPLKCQPLRSLGQPLRGLGQSQCL